jgi:hypothetical protein
MGRVRSMNGVAAGLYFLLALWVWFNPSRARRLWRRLEGQNQ